MNKTTQNASSPWEAIIIEVAQKVSEIATNNKVLDRIYVTQEIEPYYNSMYSKEAIDEAKQEVLKRLNLD